VDIASTGPVGRDTALVTRLVVDAVLLALEAAYAFWVSRTNRGSPIRNLFFGRRPSAGRERWVGAAVTGVAVTGLLFGTDRCGYGTQWVNVLVFLAALTVVYAGVQAVHNRAVDRR